MDVKAQLSIQLSLRFNQRDQISSRTLDGSSPKKVSLLI
jgi:hypothetical protein